MKPYTVHTYAREGAYGRTVVDAWMNFKTEQPGTHIALRLKAKDCHGALKAAKAARRWMEQRRGEQ